MLDRKRLNAYINCCLRLHDNAILPCNMTCNCGWAPTWDHREQFHLDAVWSFGSSLSPHGRRTSCHWWSRCQEPTAGLPLGCPVWGWEECQCRRGACLSMTAGSTWWLCSPMGKRPCVRWLTGVWYDALLFPLYWRRPISFMLENSCVHHFLIAVLLWLIWPV